MKKNYFKLFVAMLFASNLMAQNIPSYVPTNGLVGWWPFNGNANDESGNKRNGYVSYATLSTDRNNNSNNSYNFKNVNDNIQTISNISMPLSSFSVSYWLSPNNELNLSAGHQVTIEGTGNAPFQIGYHTGGIMVYIWGSTEQLFKVPINLKPNEWHHIAITVKESSNVKIYIDGTGYDVGTAPSNFKVMNNGSFIFGRSASTYWPSPFNGKLDDIAFWNRILSEQEIKGLYSSSNPCENLTAPTTISTTQNFCQIDKKRVSDLNPSGAMIQWYKASAPSTKLSTSEVLTTAIYFARTVSGTCESDDSLKITVNVSNPSTPTTASLTQNFCQIAEQRMSDFDPSGVDIN